jgi:hypothetical protein
VAESPLLTPEVFWTTRAGWLGVALGCGGVVVFESSKMSFCAPSWKLYNSLWVGASMVSSNMLFPSNWCQYIGDFAPYVQFHG